MLNNTHWHRTRLCLALILIILLLAAFRAQARASTRTAATEGPTLQMSVGFDDDSRVNYWTPVQITLSNDGADFTGTLSATTYSSQFPSGIVIGTIPPWSYQQPITLPHGTQKHLMLYIPFYELPSLPRGIVATVSDSHGKVILTQNQTPYTLREGAIFVGILSDQQTGFDPLSAVTLPSPTRSIEVATLNANTLPNMAEALAAFDVIVLDNFTTSTLNPDQLTALQTWVNQGGALIEVGGSQWQRTLSPLPPALLPVVIHGTDTIAAGTHLLPIGSPTIADSGQKPEPDILKTPLIVSTATIPGQNDIRQRSLSNLETALASGTTPLLVQAHQGQGIICYLAFDPATAPITNWAGAIALWKGLLFRTLGDQFLIPDDASRYSNGPGALTVRNGMLQILQPETRLLIWQLVSLLLGYIILIGPVRFLIMRRLKRPHWSWRIVLSGAVIFSLFTYGLAFSQRAATVNSISIIQLNQAGSSAHVTTYFSVFIPGQGDFQVRIPGRSLAQPILDGFFPNGEEGLTYDEQSTITLGQRETDVNFLNIGTWTLHPIVSEQDRQLQGGIVSHLSLRNGLLVGSVTNTLGTSLSEVYVLLPHSFAYIGHLPAGETQQVSLPLRSATGDPGSTLADQIARSNGLPAPFFPYAHSAQPQTAFERHLAILSALSGEGFSFSPCAGPCSTHAIVTKHTIVRPAFDTPPVNPIDSNDPLLLTGAPATLIGWANQPLASSNAVTVNGLIAGGSHENFIQIPLNINFSGLVPSTLIAAQVINAQGNNVQTTLPAVYSMSTGSITFEFVVPQQARPVQINNMTITEAPGLSHAQVRLYNWSTSSWDAITLSQDTFTTANIKAYTNPDGRVLLQLVNQSASPGVFTLSKPLLSLNSTPGL